MPRTAGVYYGWWIVAASCTMMFFASGIFFRGFAIFFVPLRDSLKLSNFQTSLVFSISRAEGGLEGPAAGWMIERFGTRKLAVAGILIAGVGYLAFSQVESFLWFALAYLGSSVAFQHALFASFNMWFIRRRALVLSLLAASASLGGVVLIPVITLLTLKVGWEWAAFGAGLVFLFGILPFCLVLRHSPESMGLLPDGEQPQGDPDVEATTRGGRTDVRPPVTDNEDFTVREALHTSAFWLLLAGMGLRQLAVMGILVNLQPILIWKGASQETVGYLLSFMLGVNVGVRIILGWAADRWPKPPIMALCLATGSVGIILLLAGSWDGSPWAILLYLVLTGIGDSAGIIGWAALGEFYGRRKFASLRGLISFSQSWALVGSPIFVGWWADHSDGDYVLPLVAGAVLLGAAAPLFAMMRKPGRIIPERRAA